MVVQRRPDRYLFYTYLSAARWEQSGPFELRSDNAPGVAAMAWQDTNGCYAAASVYDIGDITNARVEVNGTRLIYNRTLSFTNGAGRPATFSQG